MLNESYVSPVQITSAPPSLGSPPASREKITAHLAERGVHLELVELLKGGAVSQVYSATATDGSAVVVKYTNDLIGTDPTEPFLDHRCHFTDSKVLQALADVGNVRVPDVLHAYDDVPLTVMEDLRTSGFRLILDSILDASFVIPDGRRVGSELARIQQRLAQMEPFPTGMSARQNIYDRGFELRLMHADNLQPYLELEERFLSANQQLTVVDTHPKNMFVDDDGATAWIDFGFSAWVDRDFALPNCMAHFVIYSLAGYLAPDAVSAFVRDALAGYRDVQAIDEEGFCKYLGSEVLHRSMGKRTVGVDNKAKKLRLANFGLTVFEDDIRQSSELLEILGEICNAG